MALPKSDSMVVHTGGSMMDTTSDITDEIITSPFCIEALLAANTLPDIPEEEFDINAVTESELSFNMMNNHLTNVPPPLGEQGVGVELNEQQKREEEEDARLAAQYMAERERRPKGTLTKLRANDIERGLHADTVKTPPRVTANGRLDTPPTGPRNWGRDITSISRSPGTWNLNLYSTGAKEYRLKETYGSNPDGAIAYSTNDVFGHLGEKRDAMRLQRQHAKGEALATFFIHGTRYNPTDPNKDQGFRTLMIPCPEDMKLEDVIRAKLRKVGHIYHGQMCETGTIPGSTGSRTAKIIFVNQPEWIDDEVELAKLSMIDDKPAYKIITKTWPMSEKMIKDIADGATRTIILTDCPNFGSLTGQDLQDAIVDTQGLRSPCHYALGHHILILDSDGADKVCIVMNSIANAILFMEWLQSERRAFGVAEFKWEFGLDISMTATELAHHNELTEMRRTMLARIDERGRVNEQDLPTDEADDASPLSHTSSSSMEAEASGTKVDNPIIDKTTIARDASSSSLYSGPLAYKPCTGFKLDPTASTFSPATKQFSYAPFPSVSGSFYADGPTEAQRGELYKKANRQAYKQNKGPGFVYRDGPVRPQTPGRVEVPKMGLYQPKGATNWADEEDDDEGFDVSQLEFSGGVMAPKNTPVKVKATAVPVGKVGASGSRMDDSKPRRSYTTANPTCPGTALSEELPRRNDDIPHPAPSVNPTQSDVGAGGIGAGFGLDGLGRDLTRPPGFADPYMYPFFGATAYQNTSEPENRLTESKPRRSYTTANPYLTRPGTVFSDNSPLTVGHSNDDTPHPVPSIHSIQSGAGSATVLSAEPAGVDGLGRALSREPTFTDAYMYSFFGATAYEQHTDEPKLRVSSTSSTQAVFKDALEPFLRGAIISSIQAEAGAGFDDDSFSQRHAEGVRNVVQGAVQQRVQDERRVGGAYDPDPRFRK